MLIRISPTLYFSLLVILASAPASAQQNPEKSVVIPVASDGDRAAQLSVSNPFFMAYKNQWYFELDTVEQRYTNRISLAAQTVSGIPFPASTAESRSIDTRLGGEVRYGITDRIIAGVRGNYLVDREGFSTYTGIFSSSTTTSTTPKSGFMNPSLGLVGRLLGTKRDEWYVDLIGTYTPGIKSSDKNALTNPAANYDAGLALGRNAGPLTIGINAIVSYSPETTYNGFTYRSTTAILSEGIVQYEFGQAFINALVGLVKYVDPNSANDPLSGKVRTFLAVQMGVNVTQNLFAKASFGWLMPVSAETTSSGLTFVLKDTGGPAVGLTVGFRL